MTNENAQPSKDNAQSTTSRNLSLVTFIGLVVVGGVTLFQSFRQNAFALWNVAFVFAVVIAAVDCGVAVLIRMRLIGNEHVDVVVTKEVQEEHDKKASSVPEVVTTSTESGYALSLRASRQGYLFLSTLMILHLVSLPIFFPESFEKENSGQSLAPPQQSKATTNDSSEKPSKFAFKVEGEMVEKE